MAHRRFQRNFDVQVEHRDGVAVVRPCGELDVTTVPRLRSTLAELRGSGENMLIDLAGVSFIDSTALRLVWDVTTEAKDDGTELTLTPGPPEVMRVFELTGLNKRLPFAEAT
jgi:anti-sigma B factor antagonist